MIFPARFLLQFRKPIQYTCKIDENTNSHLSQSFDLDFALNSRNNKQSTNNNLFFQNSLINFDEIMKFVNEFERIRCIEKNSLFDHSTSASNAYTFLNNVLFLVLSNEMLVQNIPFMTLIFFASTCILYTI